MEKMDYKKKFKALYHPKSQPSVIEVPKIQFIQIDGRGNPNEEHGKYQSAVETLYALSDTIKMMPKSGDTPPDYFEYVVPPFEGLWWLADSDEFDYSSKSKFCWTSIIRQPDFVTNDVFIAACGIVEKKKPHLDLSKPRLASLEEGLCVQCMHHEIYLSDLRKIHIAKMKTILRCPVRRG